MIEFNDLTLIETHGSYIAVLDIMGCGSWMLRTRSVITTEFLTSSNILHCWHDGMVVLMETDHPLLIDASDDDIRELSKWCKDNGWSGPFIDSNLIRDPRHFEFWFRLYRSGLVFGKMFDDREQEDVARLASYTPSDGEVEE